MPPGTHVLGPFQRALVSPVDTPRVSSGAAGTGTSVCDGTSSLPFSGPAFATIPVRRPERSVSARPRPPSVLEVETAFEALRVLMFAAARPTRRSMTLSPSMPGAWSSTIARSTWAPTLARWWYFWVPFFLFFFLPARAAGTSTLAAEAVADGPAGAEAPAGVPLAARTGRAVISAVETARAVRRTVAAACGVIRPPGVLGGAGGVRPWSPVRARWSSAFSSLGPLV